MLHATDYSNMGLQQMNRRVEESKRNDQALAKTIQSVIYLSVVN